jgi:hypothetical protein
MGMSLINTVLRIAAAEIGTVEHGKNTGKRVKEYQAATWLDGTGWAWCAAFVDFCIMKAGEEVALPFKRPRTAGAWDLARWAREEGLKVIDDPKAIKRGMVLCYEFSHTGFAETDSDSAGNFKAIEGNTNEAGSREGDGVFRKTRNVSAVRNAIVLE